MCIPQGQICPDVISMENNYESNECLDNNQVGHENFSCSTDTNDTSLSEDESPYRILQEIKKKNVGRIIIGHLNINSIRNKFESLKSIVQGKIDVLIISETKIDESFPLSQFSMDGFCTPFRLDRNSEGGGILIYINNNIPCKQLRNHDLPTDIEGMFIEINLRKKKWLIFGGYNPHKEHIAYFLDKVGGSIDKYISIYDNLLLLGDFNTEINNIHMKEFIDTYNLKNLIS